MGRTIVLPWWLARLMAGPFSERRWQNKFMVNNVHRTVRKHLHRAGIKLTAKLFLHTFRKSCCQNWADHLPMNVTKELMGRANISTTAKYYSQVDEDHRKKAARVIDELLDGIPSQHGLKKD
jgi:integrase